MTGLVQPSPDVAERRRRLLDAAREYREASRAEYSNTDPLIGGPWQRQTAALSALTSDPAMLAAFLLDQEEALEALLSKADDWRQDDAYNREMAWERMGWIAQDLRAVLAPQDQHAISDGDNNAAPGQPLIQSEPGNCHKPDQEALDREVHAAWRDGMLRQGREVAPQRMNWDTLSPEDRALDAYIAQRVAGPVLARVEAAEAELKRVREAAAELVSKWNAEYAEHGPEHDYEEGGGYLLGKGDCADALQAALAGSEG